MAAPEPPRVTAEAGEASAPAPTRLAVGDVIGRYRVDAVLGAGGMGMVVRARDLDLDRDVALKIAAAASDPARDRRRAELLLREARVMARLRVRHVRAVHDVGSARGIDYLAMEYIAGVDLARWLAAPRRLADVARVFTDAARGLAAAHAAGVLHRDFKPSNVLVGDDGEIVVTDFGLSRWMGEAEPAEPAGTPHYTAPDADPSDPRADQYSFCVALGDALAGLPADAGPARLRGRLARVVRRGSAPAAAARYPSMAAVVAALEAAVRRPRWPLAVAAVVAGAVAAVLAGRGGPAGPAGPVRAARPAAAVAGDPLDARIDRPIDLELAQAAALTARGYFRSARRAAETATALARATAPGRLAAARYAAGLAALLDEDTAAARPALEDAAQLADQGADDRLRARALVALLQAAVTRGSDLPAAERAERAAEAAMARIEPGRGERARLRFWQAMLAARRGDTAAWVRMLAEARELATPPAADDLDQLNVWCEVLRTAAGQAWALGDPDTAIATLRAVIAASDELAGRDHMESISTRGQLALVLEAAGREAEAQAMMAELRAAGRTAAGARLLDESIGPPRATRPVRVAVRDRAGAPVAGATVVAAIRFHASARHLLGASSLYDEREQATAIATTDARGIAELAAADHARLWLAAEHAAIGRSPAAALGESGAIDLVLAPWGAVSGTAPAGARISLTPAERTDAPAIVLHAARDGRFASDRIPEGAYVVGFCVRIDAGAPGDAERCGARGVVVSARPVALALGLPAGQGSLVVHPRDELGRPIESGQVLLVPADYAPADLPAFEAGWPAVVARAPGAFVGWRPVHAGAAARFADLPRGRYALCAAAIHGDTEDPSFASRLEARRARVPLYCAPVAIGDAPVERDLVIPAAQRVWLGDEPPGEPTGP